MKIRILRDAKGEIVATFEHAPDAPVSMEPEVERDEELIEVDVPDEYSEMEPAKFLERLKVDVNAKKLEIKPVKPLKRE